MAATSTVRNEKGIDWFTKSVGCVSLDHNRAWIQGKGARTSIGLRKVAVTSTPPQAVTTMVLVGVNLKMFSITLDQRDREVRTVISFWTAAFVPSVGSPIQTKDSPSTLSIPIHATVCAHTLAGQRLEHPRGVPASDPPCYHGRPPSQRTTCLTPFPAVPMFGCTVS